MFQLLFLGLASRFVGESQVILLDPSGRKVVITLNEVSVLFSMQENRSLLFLLAFSSGLKFCPSRSGWQTFFRTWTAAPPEANFGTLMPAREGFVALLFALNIGVRYTIVPISARVFQSSFLERDNIRVAVKWAFMSTGEHRFAFPSATTIKLRPYFSIWIMH